MNCDGYTEVKELYVVTKSGKKTFPQKIISRDISWKTINARFLELLTTAKLYSPEYFLFIKEGNVKIFTFLGIFEKNCPLLGNYFSSCYEKLFCFSH